MSDKLKLIVKKSRVAFVKKTDSTKKDKVLKTFANLLLKNKYNIIKENYKDIRFAKKKD